MPKITVSCSVLTIVILSVLTSACSDKSVSPTPSSTPVPSYDVIAEVENNSEAENVAKVEINSENDIGGMPLDYTAIPLELALEDFDYMVNIMTSSASYTLEMAERKYGIDAGTIFNNYRKKINSYVKVDSDTISLKSFLKLLNNCAAEFKNSGHFNFIDAEIYAYIHNISFYNPYYTEVEQAYFEDPKVEYIHNVLTSENTHSAYRYLCEVNNIALNPMDIAPEPKVVNEVDYAVLFNNSGIITKFIDENTAYIKIPSFSYLLSILDPVPYRSFIEYYTKAGDYDNLIIDITGNGGGSTMYYQENIVAPLLKESVNYTGYAIAPAESLVTDYLDILNNIAPCEDKNEVMNLPKFAFENSPDDFTAYKISWEIDTAEKLFDGSIYVLIDDKNYSAADSFADFCKKTGFATLVGTNTHGDGIGFDPVVVGLPHTGLAFRFSSTFAINSEGLSNEEFGTAPDYYTNPGETALEACLRIIESAKNN